MIKFRGGKLIIDPAPESPHNRPIETQKKGTCKMKYALFLIYVFNADSPDARAEEWAIDGNLTLEECIAESLAHLPTADAMGAHLGCDIDRAPESWGF